ncbi:hypothetical protein HDV00_011384 [Rhizophlyctis rosea]|nr:hypothetical protein HDV00_011384 [Rhizophlyctis rosea]
MARLIAFGRRWNLASDALVVPYLLGFFVHFCCIVVMIIVTSVAAPMACKLTSSRLKIYLPLFFVAVGCLATSELTIACISLRGTMADERPRRFIRHFIHLDAVLLLCALAVQILGLSLLYSPSTSTCKSTPLSSIFAIFTTVITVSTFLWLLALVALFFTASPVAPRSHEAKLRIWKRRLNICFFGHRTAGRDVLAEIARFFGEFFEGVDLAGSDVVAGVVLLRNVQRERKQKMAASLEPLISPAVAELANNPASTDKHVPMDDKKASHSGDISPPNPPPSSPDKTESTTPPPSFVQPPLPTSLPYIIHFFSYAQAIYGLPLHLWRVLQGEDVAVVRALMYGVEEIYVSRSNGLFRSPFFISRDPSTRTIVIAVRGTLSTADMVVDLSMHVTELDLHPATTSPDGANTRRTEDGNVAEGAATRDGAEKQERHWAHTGMLRTAHNIAKEIERVGALELPELKGQGRDRWSLVVCGHSLGAGIAALLCHHLLPKHPHAIAYAYSPPGCLLSSSAASYFSAFCTSVVLGDDIVPRLSHASLERAKREIKVLVETCDKRKADVVGNAVLGILLQWVPWVGRRKRREAKIDVERGQGRELGAINGTSELDKGPGALPMQMYVPGRVLHFEKIRDGYEGCLTGLSAECSRAKEEYRVRWAAREDFCEIMMSGTMFTDHLPFNVKRAMDLVRGKEDVAAEALDG